MPWWVRLLPVWLAVWLTLRRGPVITIGGHAFVELCGKSGPGCCASTQDRLILVEVNPKARGGVCHGSVEGETCEA